MENMGFSKSREDVLADTRKWMSSNLSIDGINATDQNNNQVTKAGTYNAATAGYSSMNQGSSGYSSGNNQGYSQQSYNSYQNTGYGSSTPSQNSSSSGVGAGASSGYSNTGASGSSQYGYNQQSYGNYGQGNSYSSSYSTYNSGNASASSTAANQNKPGYGTTQTQMTDYFQKPGASNANYNYSNTQSNTSGSQATQYGYSSQSTGNVSGTTGMPQSGGTSYQTGASNTTSSGMYGSSYSSGQSSTYDNSIQKQVYETTKETLQNQYGNLYAQNNKPSGTETNASSLSPAEMWPINCIACNFPIKNIKNLYRHIDGHWWKDRNCIICTVPVPGNVSNFQVHLKTHSGETMYVCATSKRSFLSKDKVLQHVMQQKNTTQTPQGRLYYEFLIDVTSAENAKSDTEGPPTTTAGVSNTQGNTSQTTTAGGAANAKYFPELYDKVQSNLGSSILQGTNTGSYGSNAAMNSGTSNANLGYSAAYKPTTGSTASTAAQNPSQNAGSYGTSYQMQTSSANSSALKAGMAVYTQTSVSGTQSNPSYTTSYKMPAGGTYNATTYNNTNAAVTQASTYPGQSTVGYTTSYKMPAGQSNTTGYNNGVALASQTNNATSNYSSSSSAVKPAYNYNTSTASSSFTYSGPNGNQNNQYQKQVYPATTTAPTNNNAYKNNTGTSYFSNTQTTYGNTGTNQQTYSTTQNNFQKPGQPAAQGMANTGTNPNYPNSYNAMQSQQATTYNANAAMFGGSMPETLPDGTLVCKECKFQAKQPRYLQAHMKRMHSTPQNGMYNITYNYSVPQPTQLAVPVPPAVKPQTTPMGGMPGALQQPYQQQQQQQQQPNQQAPPNVFAQPNKGFINEECDGCDKPTSNLEKFYHTWKEDFSDRAFCVLCGFKTYTGEERIKEKGTEKEDEASFQRHLEVHVGQDLYVCGMCKVSSSTMDVMAKHVDAHNQMNKKKNEGKEGKKEEEEVKYIRYAIAAQWKLRNYCECKKDTKTTNNNTTNNNFNNRQQPQYSSNRYTYVGPPPPQGR